jgi:hypothetical protein
MVDEIVDIEQFMRIQTLESRVNLVESTLSGIQARLDQAVNLLKVVGVGLGMVLGIDLQGVIL